MAGIIACFLMSCKKEKIENRGKKAVYHIEGTDTLSYLAFPNSFTPDGDGTNDNYYVIGKNIRDAGFELNILDKKGVIIYRANSLYQPWDGAYRGMKAADGIYYCKINATDTTGYVYEVEGTVNLME